MKHETLNTGAADSLRFCCRRANSHTYQSTHIQRHIIQPWNPPPFFLNPILINTQWLILSHSQEATTFWSVTVNAHAYMAVVHRNPHVVSPSCQGAICLHYHHTAGGGRSFGAHGSSDASLSRYKTQPHRLNVFHVGPTQDRRH